VVNGVLWGIPLRSHISHDYVLWTDKNNSCGIDFTKAVVITDPNKYISGTQPHIRPDEFKVLKKFDEYRVKQKLQQYVKAYKKAKAHPEIQRNKQLLQFSTLQYFEKYI
jgi:protein AbiQ